MSTQTKEIEDRNTPFIKKGNGKSNEVENTILLDNAVVTAVWRLLRVAAYEYKETIK